MSKDNLAPLLAIFWCHFILFLYSIYSLQVSLQVITLSHPKQCLKFWLLLLQNLFQIVIFFTAQNFTY